MNARLLAGTALTLVVSGLVAVSLWLGRPYDVPQPRTLPDFTEYDQVDELKAEFFGFLEPIVVEVNEEVLDKRQRLEEIRAHVRADGDVTRRDQRWLDYLSIRYRVGEPESVEELIDALLPRVDRVPESLALSQAAIESGWGRSRFAVQGNNLFGQWCYDPGCGLIPGARGPHASHEVEVFDSVDAAVRSYVRNINSHPAYRELRAMREDARENGQELSGVELAAGLIRYSERGQAYVNEVRSMIRANDLES